ncbi:hypothetical protein [Microbacterium deminutum]|uniref:hypothetical protein n=1 Tax=Microbacterium deminutum TaxID=344164 RepID=UPI0031D640E9
MALLAAGAVAAAFGVTATIAFADPDSADTHGHCTSVAVTDASAVPSEYACGGGGGRPAVVR